MRRAGLSLLQYCPCRCPTLLPPLPPLPWPQAGLLLAETEFHLQVESDIAPYKGLLMGLFFMTGELMHTHACSDELMASS